MSDGKGQLRLHTYTTRQVASMLQVHMNQVRRLYHDGKLHGRAVVIRGENVRPRLRFTEADVADYLSSLDAAQAEAQETVGRIEQPRPRKASADSFDYCSKTRART